MDDLNYHDINKFKVTTYELNGMFGFKVGDEDYFDMFEPDFKTKEKALELGNRYFEELKVRSLKKPEMKPSRFHCDNILLKKTNDIRYVLNSFGDYLEELEENAVISEIDNNNKELKWTLGDFAKAQLYSTVERELKITILKTVQKQHAIKS